LAAVATGFLRDAVKFSKTYNSSDYGLKNRAQLIIENIEDLKLQEAELNDGNCTDISFECKIIANANALKKISKL